MAIYTYHKRASFPAKVISLALRTTGVKHNLGRRLKANKLKPSEASVPKQFLKEFSVDINRVKGHQVFTVGPKDKSPDVFILYLHGGAYVGNIFLLHWKLIGELIKMTGATFIVPDYPLAPTYTAADAFPFAEQVYSTTLQKAKPENILFMGDSAGAGFALGLAQKLHKEGKPQPAQIILLSPWLDLTLTNPGIKDVEKNDPMLEPEGLQMAGKAWAGHLDTKNYLVSPIYGDLEGLGKISVYIGGNDIFIADSRKFKSIMDRKGIPINYFCYPDMIHTWMVFTFLKEAKYAIKQISALIINGGTL